VTSRLTTPTKISLIKQQFAVTHTIRQTEYLALLHAILENILSVKILKKKKKMLLLTFSQNITCLSVGLLRTGHGFSVSYKTVYQ
jgi:hypothetical protein